MGLFSPLGSTLTVNGFTIHGGSDTSAILFENKSLTMSFSTNCWFLKAELLFLEHSEGGANMNGIR